MKSGHNEPPVIRNQRVIQFGKWTGMVHYNCSAHKER